MKENIDNLIEKLYPEIYGWSLVDDKWTNELNAYLNVKISQEIINMIWLETMYFGIILTGKKLERQLSEAELAYLEENLLSKIVNLMGYFTDKKVGEMEESHIKKLLERDISKRQETYSKGNVVQHYLSFLKLATEDLKLNDEILINYATNKIDVLERGIFNSELQDLLHK